MRANGQRGFALIAVMFLGAAAMYVLSGAFGDGALGERRAQERELLQIRAYWAAHGQITYALSRLRGGPPCGGNCANSAKRATYYTNAMAELDTAPGRRDWVYPEIAADYLLPVSFAIARRVPDYIEFSTTFSPVVSAHPVITAHWPARRPFIALVCSGYATVDEPVCPTTGSQVEASGIAKISEILPQ